MFETHNPLIRAFAQTSAEALAHVGLFVLATIQNPIEHADRIVEALRCRVFEVAQAIWNAIQTVHKPMRWESATLAEMVWQRLGEDSDNLRVEFGAWRKNQCD